VPRAFRLRVGFPDEVTARRRSWMLAPSARRPSPSARGGRGDGQWRGGAPTAGAGCALWQADPADFGHREAITPAHLRHGRAAARRRPGEVAARRRSRIRAPPRTRQAITAAQPRDGRAGMRAAPASRRRGGTPRLLDHGARCAIRRPQSETRGAIHRPEPPRSLMLLLPPTAHPHPHAGGRGAFQTRSNPPAALGQG